MKVIVVDDAGNGQSESYNAPGPIPRWFLSALAALGKVHRQQLVAGDNRRGNGIQVVLDIAGEQVDASIVKMRL
jgi:hypothetical protein